MSVHKLVIIGSGPAGLTAAIYAARANLNPVIIAGNKPGGQLMGTTVVENWPGSASIMGPQLMIDMQEHVKKFNVSILDGSVTAVNFQSYPFSLIIDGTKNIQAHSVIIASGATPNRLHCPGEQEFWGKGVSTCATCDGAFYKNQRVVVVGGGDSSMEAASFLQRNGNHVTIVHIGDRLTASFVMQQRVLNQPNIDIMYNSTVTEIFGSGDKVHAVTVEHQNSKQKVKISTDAVFLAIGLKPNTVMFQNQLELSKIGHLLVHDLVKTSVEGIFACGDVIDPKYRQAIVSAGFGCIAALEAERFLVHKNI
ncbi:thioredoxin-disulfide reductase [Candidatus Babeliales bacterium]|nr:thioredoxin-disulfide reductase [Candidatus Babeliales bacterium]